MEKGLEKMEDGPEMWERSVAPFCKCATKFSPGHSKEKENKVHQYFHVQSEILADIIYEEFSNNLLVMSHL